MQSNELNIATERRSYAFLNRQVIPKSLALTMCLAVLLFVYLIGAFTSYLGVPVSAYYVTDLLITICLLISIRQFGDAFFSKPLRAFTVILALLVFVDTISALINGFQLPLWVWSLRNWGRFFIYFYLCCALLDRYWADSMLSMTLNLFLINVIVIVIQFYFFRYIPQDGLNGLVGRDTSGANIILTLAAATIVSAQYANGLCGLRKLVVVFLGVVIVSVLAELKAALFFAAAIFAFIYLTSNRFTAKAAFRFLFLFLLGVAAVAVGINVLNSIYGMSGVELSLEGIIKGLTVEDGYGHSGKIDRLTAISVVNRDIFPSNDSFVHLFGIGMGNAEYSAMDGFTSPFFCLYGSQYLYLRFSVAVLYIESGYVGLILYVALFAALLIGGLKRMSRYKNESGSRESAYYQAIGLGMALIGLMFIWYTNLLRTDMAVLLAFYIAIPFAMVRLGRE